MEVDWVGRLDGGISEPLRELFNDLDKIEFQASIPEGMKLLVRFLIGRAENET